MRRSILLSSAVLAFICSLTAAAQGARPSDRTVEKLIDGMQSSFREFERNLDSDLKRGTIRGKKTEVNVENYLDDFETDIKRLQDRFEPQYSASAEVSTVLERANDVDTYIKSQPPSLKGRSEWDAVAAALNELAAAYATKFPMPDDAPPRRINDAEVVQATDAVTKHATAYRKALKDAFTKEESAALQAAQKSVDALSTAAKNLKSRMKSGKPASGEAGVVAEKYAAVQASVAGRTFPEPALAAWKGIEAAVGKINQAFGVTKPAAQPASG
jgi:hypothetical protein